MTPQNDTPMSTATTEVFQEAAIGFSGTPQTSPFSMRLTVEERAYLDRVSGNRPWAEHIREKVFGDQISYQRKPQRRPIADDQKLSAVLSTLGQSRLASNLNQLAKSANMGALDVSDDTERQLQDAAMAVIAMRGALFAALGLKS